MHRFLYKVDDELFDYEPSCKGAKTVSISLALPQLSILTSQKLNFLIQVNKVHYINLSEHLHDYPCISAQTGYLNPGEAIKSLRKHAGNYVIRDVPTCKPSSQYEKIFEDFRQKL